jgi:modulator of FtsH protease HflK
MKPNGTQRNSGKDPWRSNPEEGPPDLAHLFKKIFGKFNQRPGSGDSNRPLNPAPFAGLAVLVVVLIWAVAGIFVVSPAEQSVVLRFGKYVRTLGPGPHWIPALFERHYTVNIQRVDSFPYEAEMLTQDGNIVSVKIQVQYRIGDLKNYLFNVVTPVVTLHQAASSSLRQIVGQMNLDPILTTGREELAQKVMGLLQKTLASYHSGIEVREVTLQSSKPPEAVTAAFDDVIKATEDQKRYINQAEAYAKRRVLTAQGDVSRIAQEADAYRYSVTAQATGEATRYLALLRPYQQAPVVTRERLYLETMTEVLKNTQNILADSGSGNVLYLPLQQLLQKNLNKTPSSSAPAPGGIPGEEKSSASSTSADALETDADNASVGKRPSYPTDGGGR